MSVNLWHKHPGIKPASELTVGQRAADKMRNGMGSWPFVFMFLIFMGLWAAMNVGLGKSAWDKYPFILLNLFLSMLAGLQGAILLIAAKRSDQISAELALHTFENTNQIKELLAQNTELTQKVEQLTSDIHLNLKG